MNKLYPLLYFVLAILLVLGCRKDKTQYQSDPCMNTNWMYDIFSIQPLVGSDHPYNPTYSVPPTSTGYLLDSLEVPVYKLQGVNYYHPVHMSQYAFKQLDWFSVSGDSVYFERAVQVIKRLKKIAVSKDSSVLFLNHFDFKVHDSKDELMVAGWSSAMTQGQALSLFCWMYEYTNDPNLLIWADKIYNSFHRIKGNGDSNWISCVDENGNIWMEEYPSDTPCFTLNGKIYAMIGLFDYYMATGKADVKNILMGGLTTIKRNLHRFRRENLPSLYCVKHNRSYEGYHQTHINLIKTLFKITSDSYFEDMAETFENDF